MSDEKKTKDTRELTGFERVVIDWWEELRDCPGDRAALRRCGSAADVAAIPAFHRLRQRLPSMSDANALKRLATICAVLSHVRENAEGEFARQMAQRGEGETARVSGLRFRRLMAMDMGDELLVALTRAVHLVGDRAGVASLATSIRYWGERVRMTWACAYYDAAPREA